MNSDDFLANTLSLIGSSCDAAGIELNPDPLRGIGGGLSGELGEILGTLSANLTPVGGSYRQLLTLVQLCLEEAPAELLPFTPAGSAAGSSWGKRMTGFLARLEDPAFHGQARWGVRGLKMAHPAAKHGILTGFGGTCRLPEVLGNEGAGRLFTAFEHWGPEQALEAGAVEALLEAEEVRSRVMEWLRAPWSG